MQDEHKMIVHTMSLIDKLKFASAFFKCLRTLACLLKNSRLALASALPVSIN